MKKEILIETISITKSGEIRFFTVTLPKDTHQITGIMTTVRLKDVESFISKGKNPFVLNRNIVVADLRLVSNETAGIFYSEFIKLQDFQSEYFDYSQTTAWEVTEYTHGRQFTPCSISVTGKTMQVAGGIVDMLGDIAGGDFPYEIKLYIEVERKICKP